MVLIDQHLRDSRKLHHVAARLALFSTNHHHYENLPMQYTENAFSIKNYKLHWTHFDKV